MNRLKKLKSLNPEKLPEPRIAQEIQIVSKKLTKLSYKKTQSPKKKMKKTMDFNCDPKRVSRLKSSMSQISDLDFKTAKNEGSQFDINRRKHFYRGMEMEDYHEFFDKVYDKLLEKQKLDKLKAMHMDIHLAIGVH